MWELYNMPPQSHLQMHIHVDVINIACTFMHLHKVYCTKCNEYTEFVFLKDNVYNI